MTDAGALTFLLLVGLASIPGYWLGATLWTRYVRRPDFLNERTETWGPSFVAADTLARQRRTDRANAISAEVRGAFEAYPFATTAAQIDALETTEERA